MKKINRRKDEDESFFSVLSSNFCPLFHDVSSQNIVFIPVSIPFRVLVGFLQVVQMQERYNDAMLKGEPWEVRKAVRRALPGDVIEVRGTHPASKKEIPMAVDALKLTLLSVEGADDDWTIRIQT